MNMFMKWFKQNDATLIEEIKTLVADYEVRANNREFGYARDMAIAMGYRIVISDLKEVIKKHSGDCL